MKGKVETIQAVRSDHVCPCRRSAGESEGIWEVLHLGDAVVLQYCKWIFSLAGKKQSLQKCVRNIQKCQPLTMT